MSESTNENATKTRTTQKTARKRSKAISKTFSGTERRTTRESQIAGIQGHVSNDQGTGSRGDRAESIKSTSTDPGKILEAVKLIEEKHLSYVKLHQQRLIASLDESKESECEFQKAIQELEGQIYQLISDKENHE